MGRYRCAPAEDCDHLLEQLCKALNGFPTPDGCAEQFLIIKAVFAHLYFVWIHPFGDGNGRTARLLELFILLAAGFPQPTGHLLSNHYNRTRPRYYERLEAAVRGPDQVIAFVNYSINGMVEGLREQIAYIREQQWQVAWTNYVHDQFQDAQSASDVRRRHVVMALSAHREGVGQSRVAGLTPEIALEYAGKTAKTLVRDINALLQMGLIVKVSGGKVRANREAILAFLPWRSPASDLEWTAQLQAAA